MQVKANAVSSVMDEFCTLHKLHKKFTAGILELHV